MSAERLKAEWMSYKRTVVPQYANAYQVEECRRAFYAGAAAIHDVIMKMLEPGAEATEADVRKMGELYEELTAFANEFKPSEGNPNVPKRA